MNLTEQKKNDYDAFVEKFKPKLTTDDCYTPEPVYNAVAEWVEKEYNVERSNFVRPFYPGGDYEKYIYPENAVVVDNPPFSILSKIVDFYYKKKIRFFLFAPALTILSSSSSSSAICAGCAITYENGANVNTSFLTNLEPHEVLLRSAPDLNIVVKKANDEWLKETKKQQPKYTYPENVITAAMVNYFSQHETEYKLYRTEAVRIGTLDDQRRYGKGIFGAGYLISSKAAAEKAAAEKAAATVWKLSEREKEIIRWIDEGGNRKEKSEQMTIFEEDEG